MNDNLIFAQIEKVEDLPDGTCILRATATSETVDKAKEIFDWETGVPEVAKWSEAALARSGGKSRGNIRSMHGKIAAGVATNIHFDHVGKKVKLEAHVVDPVEATKVRTGTYTGLSIGGDYLKRWPDPEVPGVMRFTPSLTEISLVDNPCNPDATFDFVKADGSSELRKFTQRVILAEGDLSRIIASVNETVSSALAKYGTKEAVEKDVKVLPAISIDQLKAAARGEDPKLTAEQAAGLSEFAAMVRKAPIEDLTAKAAGFAFVGDLNKADTWRLPIDTAENVTESLAKFHQTEGLGDQAGRVARRIVAAAKKFNIDASGFANEHIKAVFPRALAKRAALGKGMYEVSSLAQLMQQLAYLEETIEREREYERDGSPIAAQLGDVLITLKQIFIDLATEEATELVAEEEQEKAVRQAMEIDAAQLEGAGDAFEAGKAATHSLNQLTKEMAVMANVLEQLTKSLGGTPSADLQQVVAKAAGCIKSALSHHAALGKAHGAMMQHLDGLGKSLAELTDGEEEPDKKKEDGKKKADAESEKAAIPADLQKRLADLEASNAQLVAMLSKATDLIEKGAVATAPAEPTLARTLVSVEKTADGGTAVGGIMTKAAGAQDLSKAADGSALPVDPMTGMPNPAFVDSVAAQGTAFVKAAAKVRPQYGNPFPVDFGGMGQ